MSVAQSLNATGQKKIKADKEVAKGREPRIMPEPDAHANQAYFGRSGQLKSGRPQNFGRNGTKPIGAQDARQVQKARKKRTK